MNSESRCPSRIFFFHLSQFHVKHVEELFGWDNGCFDQVEGNGAEQIAQPARYEVIREKPLQTPIRTKELCGEGGSACRAATI